MNNSLPLPDDVRLTNTAARLVGGLAAVVLLMQLLIWAVHHPVFGWRGVRVEGELTHNSEPNLRANALPSLKGNFFTLDLAATRKAFEAVPWVRKAVVRRVWPGWLIVRLEEHHPAALWLDDGGNQRLVNRQGELFEVDADDLDEQEIDRLPVFSGPDSAAPLMLDMHARINQGLKPLGVWLSELHLSDRGLWEVTLNDGREMVLGRGRPDDVLGRLSLFVRSISAVEARRQALWDHVDMRHPNAYAVRFRDNSGGNRSGSQPTAAAMNRN